MRNSIYEVFLPCPCVTEIAAKWHENAESDALPSETHLTRGFLPLACKQCLIAIESASVAERLPSRAQMIRP
jgi:hypothetical protein